jgi:predicted ArsR family transcriptional regulator
MKTLCGKQKVTMQVVIKSKMENLTYPKVETTYLKNKVGRPSKDFKLANEQQKHFGQEVVIYETAEDQFE